MDNKVKKIILITPLAILLIAGGVYFYFYPHQNKIPTETSVSNAPVSNPSTTATSTSSPTSSTPPINQLQLPTLEELKAKTANWPIYENQDYKFRVKYPAGWDNYDKNTFPYGMPGQLTRYKAREIFRTNKPLDGPDDGVAVSIFFSDNFSLMPTKESMADYLQGYLWHIKHQVKTFSLLNGFEGAIDTGEGNGGRAQLGLVFKKIDNRLFYVDWGLFEDYQYSKSDYSDITYQNQFLPFLASFEIIQ